MSITPSLGSYKYDGARLTAIAQLLDMRGEKLLPAVTESGPLADLGTLQSALAWDLLRLIRADFSVPKDKYIAGVAARAPGRPGKLRTRHTGH